eukprot:scaffold24696_cov101-Phaeocystis_antarctica.AAC.6
MFGYALGAFPPSLRGTRRHTHLRIKSPPGMGVNAPLVKSIGMYRLAGSPQGKLALNPTISGITHIRFRI